ncbi:MAG: lysophospholipase [Legionellales bacterium RIFCSPHIGHO2_12_FULL_37_14]|nr:MAG: lysophospholipase [Legionellales bacterium RIFCSPHIGHO2_12_FULL_37_14]
MRYLFGFCLFILSLITSAASINKIVVFGDSLSDNGNLYEYMNHQLPQSPPYYNGRFTDGPVWAERLARSYFAENYIPHLLDYAFGGAGVLSDENDDPAFFTLKREVDTYLLAHNDTVDPNALYCVWIGGNNYLGLPQDIDSSVNEVIEGIQKDLERLAQKGAKHILIMGLPNLGKVPLAKELDAQAQFAVFSTKHNERLHNMYLNLRNVYPSIRWYYYDTNLTFENIFKNPQKYGFENITDTCYEADSQDMSSPHAVLNLAASVNAKSYASSPHDCNGYVFFDLIHPTQHIHQIAAKEIKKLLESSS